MWPYWLMTTLPVTNSTACMCGQLYGSWNSGYISSHFLFVSPCFLLSLKVGTYFLTHFDFLWGRTILDSWFQISHPCLDCCTVPIIRHRAWADLCCYLSSAVSPAPGCHCRNFFSPELGLSQRFNHILVFVGDKFLYCRVNTLYFHCVIICSPEA